MERERWTRPKDARMDLRKWKQMESKERKDPQKLFAANMTSNS